MKRHEQKTSQASHTRGTILVADDNPENIRLLFETLQGGGYRTLAAVNGERAVGQAQLAHPDLILMDVMMPGMDGFSACRQLKEDPATKAIPVIFMTALSETVDKLRGFKAGGVDYLTKPLQHKEVLARINAHLGRHRLWREIDRYSQLLLQMGAADSTDSAWTAFTPLLEQNQELAGLAFWEAAGDARLRLRHHSGFSAGGPPSWRHAKGDYSNIPPDDPLLGEALQENRQVINPDRDTWDFYPAWAKSEGLRGFIATPVTCRDQCYGLLFAAYSRPPVAGYEEHRHWQRILAQHLGNVIFQTRSMDAIRELGEQLRQENEGLRAEISEEGSGGDLIGDSPAFRRVLSQLDLVAPTEAAVLILGESGTGKELLAQRIHQRSPRASAPLIRVNCAAIPAELFESEFFGHVKGAFTGAVQDRIGRFELANGGTLFLDEVGEIPLELQGKLLRVLQEGTFERVGEGKTRHTRVRIVAATNRDLQEAISAGYFREDLYYRLGVFPLSLPPLRERPEDLPALTRHFAALYARKLGVPAPDLTDEQLQPLLNYSWPGNIRELQNQIERAIILSRGKPHRFEVPGAEPSAPAETSAPPTKIISEQEWTRLQRENMIRALRATEWRVDGPGGAAEQLGLRPTTLRSRMKSLNITRPI
ncbi:sigma 54-interacting transcriptional regulator [Kiritimatiellaeota bacterium B1221]|nr:sigma 54-interacting transcriptional regulator [Kiritimatiellaeota bacterium B1221]